MDSQSEAAIDSMFLQLSRKRHRYVARAMVVVALAAFATLFLDGPSWLKPYVGMALGVHVLAFLALIRVNAQGSTLPRHATEALTMVIALAAIPEMLYYGVFGGFPPIVIFLLHLAAMGDASPQFTTRLTLVCAIPHMLFDVLILTGLMQDPGLFTGMGSQATLALHGIAMFGLYILGLKAGHVYRAEGRRSAQQLEEAVAEVAAREALLREARRELERVVGVGEPGKLTGQILGSYSLGIVIGRGGMGEVYHATELSTGERAAVKVLHGRGIGRKALERFEREAQVAMSLNAPNVVRVDEAGGVDAPLPYIAMEYLEGEDLATILERELTLPVREVVDLVRQVAQGLEAAREKGVVHRDIKPQNLLRTTSGEWKILDFGVARLSGHSGTLTGAALLGTPAFMAPEQANPRDMVDHRTDLHALGLVAYTALTGKLAFIGNSQPVLLQSVLNDLPIRPSALARVRESVDSVLRVALAKHSYDRFDTAVEMAQAFGDAVHGRLDPEVQARACRLDSVRPWGQRWHKSGVHRTQRMGRQPVAMPEAFHSTAQGTAESPRMIQLLSDVSQVS